ncbi:MAG: HAD family hydrolase [Hyphomicrobiales bacterium]|nr:HAD family hydrolase [Hyphomicrobiales bacterium]
MAQAIETILFDFGGTLDADGVAWKERFHALYRAEGLNMTAEAFAQAFYAADDRLVGTLAPAASLAETAYSLVANLEAELAERRVGPAAEPHGAARGERVAARFLSEALAVIARNREALEALGGRRRLGVVSNFYGNLEAACESSGLSPLFSVMTDSHRVGAEKPDPAIFRVALKTLAAAPESTLFVGDSLRRDGEGARRAGLSFIWIGPQEAHAEVRAAAEPPVLATLTALPELLDILK